jgi:hypothetical protein
MQYVDFVNLEFLKILCISSLSTRRGAPTLDRVSWTLHAWRVARYSMALWAAFGRTWPVQLLPPPKLDSNCLLENLALHWGFRQDLDGAGAAYTIRDTNSSFRRIQADLNLALINRLCKAF